MDSNQYPFVPATTQPARNLRPSMAPSKRTAARARDAEYQAIWQACDRASRKDDYRAAELSTRRTILHQIVKGIMEKRRRDGRRMCGIDAHEMIERHLKREATSVSDPYRSGKVRNNFDNIKDMQDNDNYNDGNGHGNDGHTTAQQSPDLTANAASSFNVLDEEKGNIEYEDNTDATIPDPSVHHDNFAMNSFAVPATFNIYSAVSQLQITVTNLYSENACLHRAVNLLRDQVFSIRGDHYAMSYRVTEIEDRTGLQGGSMATANQTGMVDAEGEFAGIPAMMDGGAEFGALPPQNIHDFYQDAGHHFSPEQLVQ